MNHFVKEMKLLNEGVFTYVKGIKIKLIFYLGYITGDTLGMHEMFCIMSPFATHFCRICWLKKKDFY